MDQNSNLNEVVLRHPAGTRLESTSHGHIVHVPGSAGVALDTIVYRVWQAADGATLSALTQQATSDAKYVEPIVAALRAAQLLQPELTPVQTPLEWPSPERPLVSIVIVTHNGLPLLAECLPSITAQTYRPVDVILVDDRSTDGTVEWVRDYFPEVTVVSQSGGPNFAAGNNLGVRQARGELILLLNNDTRLETTCVEELVAAYQRRPDVGAVGAMLRFYDNRPFVNGLGTFTPRRRLGHDINIGQLDVGQFDRAVQIPLACFGAALIPRRVLEVVGLLDEAYEFYYEDADWSYRARASGYDLIAAPRARVYHQFGASTGSLPSAFKTRLVTRNRLRYVLKNFPARRVPIDLAAYVVDDVARLAGFLARRQSRLASAVLQGWGAFLSQVPRTRRTRGRAVSLAELNRHVPPPEMHAVYPRLTLDAVTRYQPFLTALTFAEHAPRVLIISPDTVAHNMGGVGMRYWELAHALAGQARVTLAIPNQTNLTSDAIMLAHYAQGVESALKPLAAEADIILLSGFVLYHHPFLRDLPQYRVIDLYDPTVLENLERFANRPQPEQLGLHQTGLTAYNDLLQLGDFFVCASEKQRDYWLGALTTAGRINPHTYAVDPTLRRLIDVVPFGVQNDPPCHAQRVLKGVRPGIGEHDQVIIWGGGLWDWLDPLTAIEAMPLVLHRVPTARLFFMGYQHPNPEVPPSRMAQRALERAAELQLTDRAVFFNAWTPYAERANYLLEADVGLSLHGDHIETRFSVRTRLMDYLWVSLPMVVTGGDTLSELIEDRGLGRVTAAGDVRGVAEALIDLLQHSIDRARFTETIEAFRWSRVAEPLRHYVSAPWRNGATSAPPLPPQPVTPLRQLPAKAWDALKTSGPIELARDVRGYVAWRLRR
jgi:GT2 family glycosyltransferase/glycosyltransferase involved in cell wall biosynthesis